MVQEVTNESLRKAYIEAHLEDIRRDFQSQDSRILVELDDVLLAMAYDIPEIIKEMRSRADDICLPNTLEGSVNSSFASLFFRFMDLKFECAITRESGMGH